MNIEEMNVAEIDEQLKEIDKYRNILISLRNSLTVPKKLLNWNVAFCNQKNYKLFKNINGKIVGIHIGSVWDEKTARQKIKDKEQSLGFEWTKEQIAIDFIQRNEPKKVGYFLALSGGKDSIVMRHLTERAGVRFQSYYVKTGIDFPEVMAFLKREYPDTKWIKPPKTFLQLIPKYGAPLRNRRWCCYVLKEKSIPGIPVYRRLMGIRAEESVKRASRGQIDHLIALKQEHYKPIFRWTEADIWEYISKHNLKYPSLYDEGWDRIGCVVCPFICRENQTTIEMHRKRCPGIYRAFENALWQYWTEKKKGSRKEFEIYLDDWYHGRISYTEAP